MYQNALSKQKRLLLDCITFLFREYLLTIHIYTSIAVPTHNIKHNSWYGFFSSSSHFLTFSSRRSCRRRWCSWRPGGSRGWRWCTCICICICICIIQVRCSPGGSRGWRWCTCIPICICIIKGNHVMKCSPGGSRGWRWCICICICICIWNVHLAEVGVEDGIFVCVFEFVLETQVRWWNVHLVEVGVEDGVFVLVFVFVFVFVLDRQVRRRHVYLAEVGVEDGVDDRI